MKLRHILAFGSFALVAYACGGNSSLGTGGDGLNSGGTGGADDDAGTYDPCSGKVCGAECSPCAPGDDDCAETAVLKYCDAKGTCGQAYPDCGPTAGCSTDNDCPQLGMPCQQCQDGSYACPSMQCLNGECVGSFESCQGSVCQSDSDCPQVGAPCSPCPDGTVSCPWSQCVDGACAGGFDACSGYEPCANRACGEECSLCNPADPTCAETAVLKYCDATGICSPAFPSCGTGGTGCQSDADCPGVGACPRCEDGSCAENQCLGGQCQLACSPPANPECKAASDCVFDTICIQCRIGTCAQPDCINGTCQRVCR
jgi:hypothetical protein